MNQVNYEGTKIDSTDVMILICDESLSIKDYSENIMQNIRISNEQLKSLEQ